MEPLNDSSPNYKPVKDRRKWDSFLDALGKIFFPLLIVFGIPYTIALEAPRFSLVAGICLTFFGTAPFIFQKDLSNTPDEFMIAIYAMILIGAGFIIGATVALCKAKFKKAS